MYTYNGRLADTRRVRSIFKQAACSENNKSQYLETDAGTHASASRVFYDNSKMDFSLT